MKKYPFKFLIALLFWSGISCANPGARDNELKKIVVKEFPVQSNTSLVVNNRYGKIEATTWNKAYVKIEGTIITRAGKKSTAQQKLDEITIDINQQNSVISAITNIESKSSNWFSGWWSGSNNAEMEINYLIQMPESLDIKFENRYGNIYLPDLKSKVNIVLKYGNLEAMNLDNDLDVTLAYGKGTTGVVKGLVAHLAYSDFRGVKANNVNVTSKYSKFYLDQASEINSVSKYDSYKLGTILKLINKGAYDDLKVKSVNSADISTKYSGVEILSLGSDLRMDISYGSLLIDDLKTSCKSIDITTKYAPIKIYGTVPSAVDIEGKYFSAKLGSDFIERTNISEGSFKHIKGFKISDKGSAKIRIVSSYGDVYMK